MDTDRLGIDPAAATGCLVAHKAKEGELEAIQQTEENITRRSVHMVELLDDLDASRGRKLPRLIDTAVRLASQGNPLWIDTRWLTPGSPLRQNPGGPFEYLDREVEAQLGLLVPDCPPLVPVANEASDQSELQQIALLREHKDRDVALRFWRLDASASELRAAVDRVVRTAQIPRHQLHLIIDASYVEQILPGRQQQIVRVVSELVDYAEPATTSLLSGSTPRVRHGYQTVIRHRTELDLFHVVRNETGDADLRYGDYGVVHPVPSAAAETVRAPNPYLTYTLSEGSLVLRRRVDRDNESTEGARAEAFAEIAEELTHRREFAGGNYSWGDRTIANCRPNGGSRAGAPSKWIAMATSHHLAHLANSRSED